MNRSRKLLNKHSVEVQFPNGDRYYFNVRQNNHSEDSVSWVKTASKQYIRAKL